MQCDGVGVPWKRSKAETKPLLEGILELLGKAISSQENGVCVWDARLGCFRGDQRNLRTGLS